MFIPRPQKNTPLFLFPYMGHSLQIFAWGMPRHAHVFSFTHNAVVLRILDVFTPKIRRKFLILTFLWIKTNVAYTWLEVIAKQSTALQVEFITGVKLICYFVLYYCFLQWDHLPNMAVGDLAFYYTLYRWFIPFKARAPMAQKLMLQFKELHYQTVSIQCMPIHMIVYKTICKYSQYWINTNEYSHNHSIFATNIIIGGFHHTIENCSKE